MKPSGPGLPSHPFSIPGRLSEISELDYLRTPYSTLPGEGRLVDEEDCVAHEDE